jgi:hypothetical protein
VHVKLLIASGRGSKLYFLFLFAFHKNHVKENTYNYTLLSCPRSPSRSFLVFDISTSNVSRKRNVLSDLFKLISDSMI